MTNKELAQALRSAASALEHGRYQTVKRKLQLVNSAWFAGNLDGAEQRIVKPENVITVTPLNMPDSAIEFFDSAVSAAESNLDNLLDKYSTEQIASYFEQQIAIHLRTELDGARKYGNDTAAFRDAVNDGRESAF